MKKILMVVLVAAMLVGCGGGNIKIPKDLTSRLQKKPTEQIKKEQQKADYKEWVSALGLRDTGDIFLKSKNKKIIAQWKTTGLSAKEAKEWKDAGYSDPKGVKQFLDNGIKSPTQANEKTKDKIEEHYLGKKAPKKLYDDNPSISFASLTDNMTYYQAVDTICSSKLFPTINSVKKEIFCKRDSDVSRIIPAPPKNHFEKRAWKSQFARTVGEVKYNNEKILITNLNNGFTLHSNVTLKGVQFNVAMEFLIVTNMDIVKEVFKEDKIIPIYRSYKKPDGTVVRYAAIAILDNIVLKPKNKSEQKKYVLQYEKIVDIFIKKYPKITTNGTDFDRVTNYFVRVGDSRLNITGKEIKFNFINSKFAKKYHELHEKALKEELNKTSSDDAAI